MWFQMRHGSVMEIRLHIRFESKFYDKCDERVILEVIREGLWG